jgi:hypothetical protein
LSGALGACGAVVPERGLELLEGGVGGEAGAPPVAVAALAGEPASTSASSGRSASGSTRRRRDRGAFVSGACIRS